MMVQNLSGHLNHLENFRNAGSQAPPWTVVKNTPPSEGDAGQSLGQEDPLEKGMATHFSFLAWRIPWTEEFMGSQTVGHD